MSESYVTKGSNTRVTDKVHKKESIKGKESTSSLAWGNSKPSHSHGVKTKSISFDDLAKHFHMPINDAAKELGICATVLKELCRRRGIQRWPHRKLKALDRLIEKYEREQSSALDQSFYQNEIESLRQKKESILRHYKRRSPSDMGGHNPEQPYSSPMMVQKSGPPYGIESVPTGTGMPHHQPYVGGAHPEHGIYEYNMYERGDPKYPSGWHYRQPPGPMQMRQMDYYTTTSNHTPHHPQVMSVPGNIGAQPARPTHPSGGMNGPSSMEHHHSNNHSSSVYGSQGRELYQGATGSGGGQYVPYAGHSHPPHMYMYGGAGQAAPGGGSYQYPSGPYNSYVYEGDQNPYSGYSYARPEPANGGKVVAGSVHERSLSWKDYQEDAAAGVGDSGTRRIHKRRDSKKGVAENRHARKKTVPARTTTIDSRKAMTIAAEKSGAEAVAIVPSAPTTAPTAAPTAAAGHVMNEGKDSKAKVGSRYGTERVIESQLAPIKAEIVDLKDASKDSNRTTSNESNATSDGGVPTLVEGLKRKVQEGVDESLTGMKEAPTMKKGKSDGSDPASPSQTGEEESRDLDGTDDDKAETSALPGQTDFHKLLASLQVTIWTLDKNIKCTSRHGPEVMAFHGHIPKVGDNIIEQVERNSTEGTQWKKLEPYMQARSGKRVERTFLHDGKRFLQIFSPLGSERSMPMFPTSIMCVEIAG
eukprot:CAMPEP_0184753832 /NCGR_PEP_ID=MMETSP0315-20130426/44298_1 /TAXON_ID=101924 /ORGANISM="Rhodosorus marinus, Strain UTEX LB 2760" /LENGTH=699 /DNA_ID=CAMNT_0027233223 /DNA_START=660 /DNA_END=2759 /DNA_ORIENTATION=-